MIQYLSLFFDTPACLESVFLYMLRTTIDIHLLNFRALYFGCAQGARPPERSRREIIYVKVF